MECEPGAAEAFEWLGLSWADRWLTELGAASPALAAVHRLAAVDDLRSVDLAGEALRYGLAHSFLLHALLVRGDCVDLTPFDHGVPLGQLTTTPVYRSDARHRGEGKAHAPGCQHHKQLRSDDDRCTLGEWVERRSAAAGESVSSRESCLCGRCGGFAVRRLDSAQLGYWRAAHEVYEATRTLDACEQHLAGACEPGQNLERCDRALQTFTRLGVVLDRYPDEPALAEYVKDLRVRHETLARRST
ncbi:hypothetical protein HC028_19385 [Planosporangium flavigriseum]|uniref:Uncharacterized protein n=1 Tax=Planosporangium flavigriseum TaxID=373681 RepID=A0A8J3LIH3_9ACTN|nr:hypothetical protein [Planosporangium flavigriseum]NJC66654.1 hypothetical protein [Planosporangium flavigriseum]GIG73527.1 hypothetical protein Pfl04_19310 [Planosporangium flavigriseum]